MIFIEYYHKEKKMIAYNKTDIFKKDKYEFIGAVSLSSIDDVFLELDYPIARPKFGDFMYQMAGMLASRENKFLCLTRNGDVREAAIKPIDNIWQNVGVDIKSIKIPDQYNDEYYEYTDKKENPFLFEAFQIKETNGFKESLILLDSIEESKVPKHLLKEWSEFFNFAYELESNKFIDDSFPLEKNIDLTKHLSFEKKVNKKNKNKPY